MNEENPLEHWVEGQPLSNAHRAEIDARKFVDYLLNPEHPAHQRGSKWEVFDKIGYDVFSVEGRIAATESIIGQIRLQLPRASAIVNRHSEIYGVRLETVFLVAGFNGRQIELRIVWQYDAGTTYPRMVTGVPKLSGGE